MFGTGVDFDLDRLTLTGLAIPEPDGEGEPSCDGGPAFGQDLPCSGRMAGHERGLGFPQNKDLGLSLGRSLWVRYRTSLAHCWAVTGRAFARPLPSTMHRASLVRRLIPLGGNRRRFKRAGLRKHLAVGLLLVSVRRHISMS